MSKRYGRNQKRAHREEIERLTTELQRSSQRERLHKLEASQSYANALGEFIKRGDYIDYALRRMSEELARAYPSKELEEAARKIISSRRDSPPVRFDAYAANDFSQMNVTVIRGEIPALRYNIQVMS